MTIDSTYGGGSAYFLKSRARWMVAWTDSDGRRKTRVATPNSERGAQATLRKALNARDSGESQGRTLTLAAYAGEWLKAKAVAGCRPRTLEAYRERLYTHVVPTLGKLRLDKITPEAIENLYARLLDTPVPKANPPRTLSPRTVLLVHTVLRSLLFSARRKRLVPTVATDFVDPPRTARYEARTLSIAEARTLLTATRDHEYGALWAFMLGTGCRFGEAAGLTWSNVDLDNATALICQQVVRTRDTANPLPNGRIPERPAIAPAKTDAGRRQVHLPSFVVAALRRQQISAAASSSALVFPYRHGGPIPETKVVAPWHEALRACGLEGQPSQRPLRMHDLRHTRGTIAADDGEDTTVIQKTLGHARQSTTADIYIGRVSKALRASADRFGALLDTEEAEPQ